MANENLKTYDWDDVTDKPVPDTTLAVQGAFAESKAVGDALTWKQGIWI